MGAEGRGLVQDEPGTLPVMSDHLPYYRLSEELADQAARTRLWVSLTLLLVGLCMPIATVDVSHVDNSPPGWLTSITDATGWAILAIVLGVATVLAGASSAVASSRTALVTTGILALALLVVLGLVLGQVGVAEPTGRYGEVSYEIGLGVTPALVGAVAVAVSAFRLRSRITT